MRAVNLLPADAYAAKPKLPYAPIVLAATAPVLAGALVYLGYSLEHSKVTDRQIALDVVQSQVAALSPTQALASAASTVATERALRQTELSDVLGKQQAWDVALDQISRVMPKGTWLTTLTAQSPTPAAAASATTAVATMQGYAFTYRDVSQALARLALVPSLSDVQLTSASVTVLGTKNVVQFSFTATITGTKS
jgi:Tfp pilus assembly protein PilN